MKKHNIPCDGWKGFKENYSSDAVSGFLVFLLALPLSMGIAQASDFDPIYGLLTAMIGGLVVSFLAGSKLTIKGPAAGLIVLVAGSVAAFGGGEQGWKYTLGVIVVSGFLQVLFGVLKFGKLSDFFPISAVYGMLAAIGIIIISKQVHVLLGQNPLDENGRPIVEPFTLLSKIPQTVKALNWSIFWLGFVSLLIVFTWPIIKNKWLSKIPAPVIVLLITIPLSYYFGFHNIKDEDGIPKYLVHFDKNLLDIIGLNVSFDGISKIGIFIKFVLMFAIVGSLETLLTVKAIDIMDVYKRKSDYNKDLIAVGVGNIITGCLGGLPMISEVARSSANVESGGKTRWANFFHGIFITIFLLLALNFSNLIPKPALAAMLIGVGFSLAHPKKIGLLLSIGKEQFAVFLTTVIVSLATDLLLGISIGIILKIIFHLYNGVNFSSIFTIRVTTLKTDDNYLISIHEAALFTNYLAIKKKLVAVPQGNHIVICLKDTKFVDHSVMVSLNQFKFDYENDGVGGTVSIKGLENHVSFSNHKFSSRKLKV